MTSIFKDYFDDESGASAIEYALLAALIGVALIGGITTFGNGMVNMYDYLAKEVTNGIDRNS